MIKRLSFFFVIIILLFSACSDLNGTADKPPTMPVISTSSPTLDSQIIISTPTKIPSQTPGITQTQVDIEAFLSRVTSESASYMDLGAKTQGKDTFVVVPNSENEYVLGMKNIPAGSNLMVGERETKPTHVSAETGETFYSVYRGIKSLQLKLANGQLVDFSSKLPTKEPENKFIRLSPSAKYFQLNGVRIDIGAVVATEAGYTMPKYYSLYPNAGEKLIVVGIYANANEDKKIKGLLEESILVDQRDITKQYKTKEVRSVSSMPNVPTSSAIHVAFSVDKSLGPMDLVLPGIDKIIQVGAWEPGKQ